MFRNSQFWQFCGDLRKNLLNESYREGFGLFESIKTCRTSLDAGCFYTIWSLLTSAAFYLALREPISKISFLGSKVMSFLQFMFSSVFWNQAFSISLSKFSDRSFRKIRNLISRKNFEMEENLQNYHTVHIALLQSSVEKWNYSRWKTSCK